MQFIASSDNLLRAVKAVGEIVARNSPQESFNQVLIRSKEGGGAYLEACCNESSAYYEIEEAEVVNFHPVCVSGEALIPIAKACQGEVSLATNIAKGVVSINDGGTQWSIPCWDGASFLKFRCSDETPPGVVVPAKWVRHALLSCKPILRDDAQSSPLAQIGFHEGHLVIGAASRNRAIYHKIPAEGDSDALSHWITLPGLNPLSQAAAFVADWVGDVTVSTDTKAGYITVGDNRFAFHPVHETVKMVQRVLGLLPKEASFKLKLDCKEITQAIKRATIGHKVARGLKVWAGTGTGLLFAEPSVASNKVNFSPIERTGEGSSIVNFDYLEDAVAACYDPTMWLIESGGTLFITSATTRCVIAGIVVEE